MGCIKSKPDSDSVFKTAQLPTQDNIKTQKQQKVLPRKTHKLNYSNEINITITKPSIKNIESVKTLQTDSHETKILVPKRKGYKNQNEQQDKQNQNNGHYEQITQSHTIAFTHRNIQSNNVMTQTQCPCPSEYTITLPQDSSRKEDNIDKDKIYQLYRESLIRLQQQPIQQSQGLHSTVQRIDISQLVNQQIQNQIVDRESQLNSNVDISKIKKSKTQENEDDGCQEVKYPRDRRSINRASGVKISMKKTFSNELGVQVSTVKVIIDDVQLKRFQQQYNQKQNQNNQLKQKQQKKQNNEEFAILIL